MNDFTGLRVVTARQHGTNDMCAICQEVIEFQALQHTACGNAYHVQCMQEWLAEDKCTCIYCRICVVGPLRHNCDIDPDKIAGYWHEALEADEWQGYYDPRDITQRRVGVATLYGTAGWTAQDTFRRHVNVELAKFKEELARNFDDLELGLAEIAAHARGVIKKYVSDFENHCYQAMRTYGGWMPRGTSRRSEVAAERCRGYHRALWYTWSEEQRETLPAAYKARQDVSLLEKKIADQEMCLRRFVHRTVDECERQWRMAYQAHAIHRQEIGAQLRGALWAARLELNHAQSLDPYGARWECNPPEPLSIQAMFQHDQPALDFGGRAAVIVEIMKEPGDIDEELFDTGDRAVGNVMARSIDEADSDDDSESFHSVVNYEDSMNLDEDNIEEEESEGQDNSTDGEDAETGVVIPAGD